MAHILFYSPFNQRSRDTESLMIAFHRQGHRVFSLSQAEGYQIHEYLRGQGIATYTHQVRSNSSAVYFLKHIIYFIQFCSKHEVEVVYSHLESANFVAAVAQFFIKAKVYICRHHIDEAALQGFDSSFFYKATYRLAKKIIVVSSRAASYMVEVEKIKPSKIIKINLAYDFSLYAKPNQDTVDKIKSETSAELTLLTACRLTKYKRADLSIQVLKKIVSEGIDAKLILLGRGEEELKLKQLAAEGGVTERVIMAGYVNNIIDYLAASDIVLHPSLLESSCVVTKEAAITGVPIVVCKDVGDFNDYLVNGENGFVVNRDTFVIESSALISSLYKNKTKLNEMANQLHDKVLELFNIERIVEQYRELNR